MDSYLPRQISQSDCEISSNCGKKTKSKVNFTSENVSCNTRNVKLNIPRVIYLVCLLSLFVFSLSHVIFFFKSALHALGMESGTILNGNIKASSKKTGYDPWEGRLNGNSCWMPAQNSNSEYITVKFVAQVTVVAIATQGAPIENCWVTSYVIRYGVQLAISQDPKVIYLQPL